MGGPVQSRNRSAGRSAGAGVLAAGVAQLQRPGRRLVHLGIGRRAGAQLAGAGGGLAGRWQLLRARVFRLVGGGGLHQGVAVFVGLLDAWRRAVTVAHRAVVAPCDALDGAVDSAAVQHGAGVDTSVPL
ncbi:hypothetical protein SDC9_175527 [bioreactor metagenome]|uniref:Uncharacterized protein n=1 Tax=bioreactor metagenome TaxID=1076179 RepID=A0A645GME5_9ZZZZ